jgi:hypothetical protein
LVEDAVLMRHGIVLYSPVERGRGNLSPGGGVFLIENETLRVLANLQTPGLETLRAATHAGLLDNDTITFVLERSDGSFPLGQWSGSLQVDDTWGPFTAQVIVRNGQAAATRITPGGEVQLWRGPRAAPVEVLSSTTVPGLSGLIGFDGSEIVYQTGSVSQANLAFWRLKSDGIRERLLGNNDPLPGGTKPAALGTATTQVFIEDGTVYLALSSSTSERTPERVLIRHRNGQFEPLLVGNSVPNGIGGVAVTTFALGSVHSGEILITATLAGGRSGVFHWHAGSWTELFSRESTFDGETPQGFTLFPAGHREDSLVVKVTFPAGRNTIHRLYSNLGDTPPPPTPPRLVVERLEAGDALLRIQGAATTRHRLLHSTNLVHWMEHSTLDTSPAGMAEQTIPLPTAAGFFRADVIGE